MTTTILTYGRVTWTNIVRPTADDMAQLSARYPQFHPLNLQDCLTETEFPKLDHQDDYLFLVVQFPVWDEKAELARLSEIDLFVAQGVLVTSHAGSLKPLVDLFERVQTDEQARAEFMGRGASPLLYYLFDACVADGFPLVRQLERDIRHIELHLFQADTQHVLRDIAVTRRQLIAMRRILRPQLDVVRGLERGHWPFIHEELDIYWGDISDHLAQLCAVLDEQSEVAASLSGTIDTLASHRIDEVVRLLTVVTIVTLPLTLLATLFGMNVLLPFADHPFAFLTVILVGLGLTLALVWYLHRRAWL